MNLTWIEIVTIVSASVAAIAAVGSCALAWVIYGEHKSDEVLVSGPIHRPELKNPEHSKPVLHCTLLNKSRRKAYIDAVEAYDQDNQRIAITWSSAIDHIGTVQNPGGLLGIVDTIDLFLRRNDGAEFRAAKVLVRHSFKGSPLELRFDPHQGWW